MNGGNKSFLIIGILIILALLIIVTKSEAASYYVADATNPNAVTDWGGTPSDANTGLSWATAWATVNKVNNTIAKGDNVYFGTGTWYGYSILPPTGTGTARTVYSCSTHTVATKHLARIRSGQVLTGGWTQHSGNVYKTYWNAPNGYSGGTDAVNNCQTLVQVEEDKMLVSVVSLANINQEGEFAYKLTVDSIYAWQWGGGAPTDTFYATTKPVVWLESGAYRNIEFFGLDLQGGKQGVVLQNSGSQNQNEIRFIHCHVAKSAYVRMENPTCFFSCADYGTVLYDSMLIRSCSLGYAIMENTGGWDSAANHGGATDFYSQSNTVIESCYVYGFSANGITCKYTNEGIIIRHNIIDGALNLRGITLYRDYCNAEVYGNILFGPFKAVAMDIGAKDDGDTYGGHNVLDRKSVV